MKIREKRIFVLGEVQPTTYHFVDDKILTSTNVEVYCN